MKAGSWRRNRSCTVTLWGCLLKEDVGTLALNPFITWLGSHSTLAQMALSSSSLPGPWPAHPLRRHVGSQLTLAGNSEVKVLASSFSFALSVTETIWELSLPSCLVWYFYPALYIFSPQSILQLSLGLIIFLFRWSHQNKSFLNSDSLTNYKWKQMWKLCLRMEKFLMSLWYSKWMQQQHMTLQIRKIMLILKNRFGPIFSPTLTPPILTGTKLVQVLQQDPVWDETKDAKCQILTAPLGFLFSDKLQILEQVFCCLQESMVTTGRSFRLEIPFTWDRWLLSAFFPPSFWVP